MIEIYAVFSWLKIFRGSKLVTPATILRDQIVTNIKNNEFSKAYKKIDYLEACAGELDNIVDCGDIWVEIGMALYQMGNLLKAEEYWKKAVNDYPACHECAVARWLLGTAQWQNDTSHKFAMNNWNATIRGFRELADEAERDRLEDAFNWYEARIPELEKCLAEQISIKFP
jgi:tetratricopeptide (TPR) repeat protein